MASLKRCIDARSGSTNHVFPRPKGRGLIEACRSTAGCFESPRYFHGRKAVASLKRGSTRANSRVSVYFHGRKAVASLKHYCRSAERVTGESRFPRPKGRGLIEAAVVCDDAVLPDKFPRPKGRGLIEAQTSFCGLSHVSTHFHGRKAVASLKQAHVACGPQQLPISTAERPWPH